MGYEVFISFKRGALDGSGTTRDFELARELHETLLKNGVNAFFSERDLSTANFTREIYRALEDAKILIVVGTKKEHVTSRWVSSEWETFLNAINADLKPDGQIYTYLEGITNRNLPLELFRYQFYTPAQKDEFVKRILQNLGKSVPDPDQILDVRVGDILEFGQYPQGAKGEIAPLEWRVLDVYDGKALLITHRLVDCKKYNEVRAGVTWETCTLRQWLNRDFMSRAFSSREQARIALTTNQNPDNPEYGTKGGKVTQDKLFALSIDEVEKYFRNNDDRMAAPTSYAIKNGAWTNDEYSLSSGEKTGIWWLRSPGYFSGCAARVYVNGFIDQLGLDVNDDMVAVRPAFWLNL